jgi:hypothetical protein
MKKRTFLLPLAVSLGGLAGVPAQATPVQAVKDGDALKAPAQNNVPPVLMLQRAQDATFLAYHTSHASHASHSSHYSSR